MIKIIIDLATMTLTVETLQPEASVAEVEQKTLADFHDEYYEVGDAQPTPPTNPPQQYPANRNPHHCTRCDREGRQRSHNRGWRCIGCELEEWWDQA